MGTNVRRLFTETGLRKSLGIKIPSEYKGMKRIEFGAKFYSKIYSKEHDVDKEEEM